MITFDGKENAFEAKFEHHQENEFCAEMNALRQNTVRSMSPLHISP
jgi:hypothetical protein